VRFATRLSARTLCWLLAGLPAVGAVPGGSNDLSTEIPAQPLQQALIAFVNSTNLHLVYVSQLAVGKISHSIPAGLPVPEGLSRLLEGTGLTYEFLGPRIIKILERPKVKQPARDDPEVSLDEIVVSAMKRDELLSTVPMSISVLSADRLSASGISDISGVAAVSTGVEYDFSHDSLASWSGTCFASAKVTARVCEEIVKAMNAGESISPLVAWERVRAGGVPDPKNELGTILPF